jgi:anthranilate phosphoribosyltransferase
VVSGTAAELSVGVALAEASIDEDRALSVLDELVRVSQEAAAAEAAAAPAT